MNIDVLDKFEELMPLVFKSLNVSSNSDLINLDITMPQFIALKVIYKIKSPNMSDLSSALGVTLGNMTIMSDRLIKDGYIERASDPDDRRIVRVHLTQKGKTLIKKITDHKRSYTEKIFSKLSESDKKSLIAIYEKIIQIIKNEQKEEASR